MYPAHFVSKLTNTDGELQETSHWLATAQACDYLTEDQLADLHHDIEAIGRMPGKMILKPESFHPRR